MAVERYSSRNTLRLSAFVLCLALRSHGAWAIEYLSNLGNICIPPGWNVSADDIHPLSADYSPFIVQFFTGLRSAETNANALNGTEAVSIGTNSARVAGFALNSVTVECLGPRTVPFTNANVEVYQLKGSDSVLIGQLGNPAVNPTPTQWPESPTSWFCTTYVDYFPLTRIVLEPSSEYRVALTEATSGPGIALMFSMCSPFATATDWRMGATTTPHDPWAGGEFLRIGIDATAILATNSPNMGLSGVRLRATLVGTNLVLSWPTSAPACHLYTLPSPEATSWSQVSTEPIIINDSYVVALPIAGPACFFRLRESKTLSPGPGRPLRGTSPTQPVVPRSSRAEQSSPA